MDNAVMAPGRERWLLVTLAGIQLTHTLDFMIMMPLGPQLTALFGITPAAFGLLLRIPFATVANLCVALSTTSNRDAQWLQPIRPWRRANTHILH